MSRYAWLITPFYHTLAILPISAVIAIRLTVTFAGCRLMRFHIGGLYCLLPLRHVAILRRRR